MQWSQICVALTFLNGVPHLCEWRPRLFSLWSEVCLCLFSVCVNGVLNLFPLGCESCPCLVRLCEWCPSLFSSAALLIIQFEAPFMDNLWPNIWYPLTGVENSQNWTGLKKKQRFHSTSSPSSKTHMCSCPPVHQLHYEDNFFLFPIFWCLYT